MTFTRGEYSIPANYRGNAFTADEVPQVTERTENMPEDIKASEPQSDPDADNNDTCIRCDKSVSNVKEDRSENGHGGLLKGLFSRLGRGFELDDLLLIGLIFLLMRTDKNDCEENTDEIILILLLLFLCGF